VLSISLSAITLSLQTGWRQQAPYSHTQQQPKRIFADFIGFFDVQAPTCYRLVAETAAALNVQRSTIHRLIARGQLTASKVGWRTIVHVASIHRLLAETVVKPGPRVRHSQRAITRQPARPAA
jgi:excisionase family DNA binding protein